jgi:sigma-B regulation protein RsbU (phosphoserine phosphatase)
MVRFRWKLFFGFLTFGSFVIALKTLLGRFAGHSLVVIAIAALASVVPAAFIAWRLNRPIQVLHQGLTRVAQGDLDVTLPRLRTRDEFEPLIDRFNEMVAALRETRSLRESLALREQVEQLQREASVSDRSRADAAERALLEASLQMEVAQHIQASLLPAGSVQLEGFDLAALSRPAASLGGDYFDFIPMPDNHLVLAIGDASGHGLSAALVMAQMHACFWALMVSDPHPLDEVLARTNALLYAKTPSNCYATALLVRVDGDARRFTYASAGHPTSYVLDRRGEVRWRLDSTGRPLGCLPDGEAGGSDWHSLDEGDTLVLVTDGILEAASPDGVFFGEGRALGVVRRHLGGSAQTIAEAVHAAIGEFAARSQDDATIVVMKVTGSV